MKGNIELSFSVNRKKERGFTSYIRKKVLKTVGLILLILIIAIVIYVLYVVLSYNRIEDNLALTPEHHSSIEEVETGTPYTVVTQNCGFGAYTADFTFFMDGGKQSWGNSKESVISCIDQAAKTAASFDPDFVLFQEVDFDSTRSYHTDQRAQLCASFPDYDNVFAVNFHSAFLMYPLTQPHGFCNSGILTLSDTYITSAVRRSLEVSTGLSKFVDLDRCYSVSRIPVSNGQELVLYNVHLSAYGGSDEIRTSQMTQLFEDMEAEYEAGNYCVCGGDFNHDFTGDSTIVLGGDKISDFGWAQPFPENLLPDCISRCMDYDDPELIATCRNCDVPYGPNCQTFVLDGFLLTDNVESLSVRNVDTGFVYADHNPVVLTFEPE